MAVVWSFSFFSDRPPILVGSARNGFGTASAAATTMGRIPAVTKVRRTAI
jgi:hypothetical protein